MKVEYKLSYFSLYGFTYHTHVNKRRKTLVFLPSTHRRRRSDLSMSRDKGGKEYLSTDGTNLGGK